MYTRIREILHGVVSDCEILVGGWSQEMYGFDRIKWLDKKEENSGTMATKA